MKRKMFKFISFTLLLLLVIYLLLVFIPRTYDVPQQKKRESTLYWDLSTGSRIGYTLVSATGLKKPYPVIFLQGGPGGPIYERNIKSLSPLSEEGYDVYLYDQVGCGYSDRLENINDYSAERHKKDLEEIVMKTGSEKVILIGQSWGAILAILFIADNPEKVDRVIFTGPGPIQPVHEEFANIKVPDSLHLTRPVFSNAMANEKAQNIRTRAMAFWAREFGVKIASDEEADNFQTYLTNETNKSTVCDTSKASKGEAGGGFYSQVMTIHSLTKIKDPRPKLKNSQIPILIMKGQCDNQRWGFTNEYLELFPDHEVTIMANAGHSIAVEQPGLYFKTIIDFLKK